MKRHIRALAGGMLAFATAMPIAALPVSANAQVCGHFIILGCFKNANQAFARLNRLGGPMVGGGAGTNVIDTNQYPNFRNGWYCVADGPYPTRQMAMSIAWKEAVPDAYVKNGC